LKNTIVNYETIHDIIIVSHHAQHNAQYKWEFIIEIKNSSEGMLISFHLLHVYICMKTTSKEI